MIGTERSEDRGRRSGTGDPYRSFMEYAATADTLPVLLHETSEWLAERNIDLDLYASGTASTDSCVTAVAWREGGHHRSVRLRLTEQNVAGRWLSDVLLSERQDHTGWIHLTVTSEEGRFVDVPRLAKRYMDVLPLSTGPVPLASEPALVGTGAVEEFLELVCDPNRTVPLFVAGTDLALPFDAFRDRLSIWTRQVRGLASAIILDPLATRDVRDALGLSHAVHPWTIRTFLPDVDPALEEDALRHRILGTSRLAGNDRAVARLLGDIARRFIARRPIPSPVTSEIRAFDRIADKALLEALTISGTASTEVTVEVEAFATVEVAETPALVSHEAAVYLEQIELVKAFLGLTDITPVALKELADAALRGRNRQQALDMVPLTEMRAALERLEEERDFALELLNEEQLDLAVAEEARQQLADENRYLRTELVRLTPATAWDAIPATATTKYPQDFQEYFEMLEGQQDLRVRFTGNPDKALELDALDDLMQFARNSWEFTLVLADYLAAKLKGFSGGVDDYIRHTPQGFRTVGPKKHARGETAATMQQFGHQRRFPVPDHIDPNGSLLMEPHFRLGRAGMASPRLYYHDASQADGHIYIGYIGVHLDNTQTN